MEGYRGIPPAPLIPRFWAPGWNSGQSLSKFQDEVGGPLTGGDPGVRLLEPGQNESTTYYQNIPPAYEACNQETYLLVPCYHLFGSEELSVFAEGIAQQAPKPYVALHPDDAKAAGFNDKDEVVVHIGNDSIQLPIRLESSLSQGLAAMPSGLPGHPVYQSGIEIMIKRRKNG
jgi:NADH-quinone oxidoreductase subunit G